MTIYGQAILVSFIVDFALLSCCLFGIRSVRIIRWLNHDISILREKLLQSLRYQEESTWEKTEDTRSIENELISKSLSVVSTPLRFFAENWSNFGTLFILAIIIQICILFVVYADGIFYYAALFGIAVSGSAAIRTLSGITLPFEVNREMEEEEIRKIQQDAVAREFSRGNERYEPEM